jgi:hypothetical protein
MATKYTSRDIEVMLEKAKAEKQKSNFSDDTTITPFVGKRNKKTILTAGFKIKHRKTGLVYTVENVDQLGDDVVISAVSGDGLGIEIPSREFKLYERL